MKHTNSKAKTPSKAKANRKPAAAGSGQSDASPLVKPTRAISPRTSLFLHVRAGGRCEFDNCNEYLLEHRPTGDPGNYAERAHIWAFSKRGPRGGAPNRPADINRIDNLMLLCKPCHTKVDNEPDIYPVEVLRKFKLDHEQRVYDLTRLSKDRDTIPLVLKGLIANRTMEVSDDEMQAAVAPNYLRLREKIEIDLTQLPDSADPSYWSMGKAAIDSKLDMLVRMKPRENRVTRVSVFALAAIPLLVYLGSKLSDKVHIDLYQRHRHPESWNWHEGEGDTEFSVRQLREGAAGVGLVLNVSGTMPIEGITAAVGDVKLYELNVSSKPATPLVLNTRGDLNRFVATYVAALEQIRTQHPGLQQLHVFPAVPAPIAVSMGRHTLPKIGPRLVIYDHDRRAGTLSRAVEVG